MADPISLAAERARRASDAEEWTPLDALKWLVTEIEEGRCVPVQLVVSLIEKKGDNDAFGNVSAGVDRPNHVALLALAQHSALDGWWLE